MKISDFKMCEDAPFKLPPARPFIELVVKALGEEEKLYGPVLRVKFIKHALWFVAQQTGEKPPEDIKTPEQIAEYLVPIFEKYPVAYGSVLYGQLKAEKDLEGRTGTGAGFAVRGGFRDAAKGSSVEERNVDLDDIILKSHQTWISLGVATHKLGYKKNEDKSVDIIFPECHVREGCRMCLDEGIMKRIVGGLQCLTSSAMCQLFKLFTGYDWDYTLLEFDKPHCIAKCYM